MRTKIAAITLTLMLVSCIPEGTLTPTESITTKMVVPTKAHTPTAIPAPALTAQSLYIVDISSGEATPLYQTEKIQNHLFWIGTACWAPTGQTIEFLLHSRIGRDNQPPVLYTINRDGNNLQALFSLPGLENAWFGTCSPDGQELVLSIPGNWNVAENGLYLINRNTGHSRQILSSYYASIVRVP